MTFTKESIDPKEVITLYHPDHNELYQALLGEVAIAVLTAQGKVPEAVKDDLLKAGVQEKDLGQALELLGEVQVGEERRQVISQVYRRTVKAK